MIYHSCKIKQVPFQADEISKTEPEKGVDGNGFSFCKKIEKNKALTLSFYDKRNGIGGNVCSCSGSHLPAVDPYARGCSSDDPGISEC